jgi:hypothetical protein
MTPSGSIPLMALGMVLLCGCAAIAQSSSVAPEREPDCSFRSATTCWTMASRFPTPRPEARDSVPDELLNQPATLLASGADTAASR